ncbi:hypothetical protein B0O99DRAFT_602172 [Bisporella sp. PMI_857]|nr:hypothetical protein B0O99DRAFT_602172 [Bisporella sp. PMI_857]
MRLTTLLSSLFLALLPSVHSAALNPGIRNVFTFPINTFVENIAIRSNGNLLVTSPSVPTLFSVDPLAPSPNASVIVRFPEGTGPWGITESSPDTFIIVTGIWDFASTRAALGSLTVWALTLPTPSSPLSSIRNVTTIANSTIINGLAPVPGSPHLILGADSAAGAVYRINTRTSTYSVVFSDPLFLPTATANLGINGIRTKAGWLYFTNSAQGIFGRVPINSQGEKTGAVEVLSNVPAGIIYDDFALNAGEGWIASHPNEVVQVKTDGSQSVVTNTTLLLNPTSAQFGRGSVKESKTLYVTNGGWFAGNDLVNGSVVAVDL